ncbi:MAG: hypothetical protein KIY11_03615 [Thermoplasmata archaeon]|nr:hypothetical protein [Candidatus Sysuiplasma acidicola]MDH2905169.1 hypothetical protein [Methanomassiliicoccales archaeon]
MVIARIHRKAALIIVPYAAAVIALNIYLSSFGYVPLVFYSSLFWIVMPFFFYAAVRTWFTRRREEK